MNDTTSSVTAPRGDGPAARRCDRGTDTPPDGTEAGAALRERLGLAGISAGIAIALILCGVIGQRVEPELSEAPRNLTVTQQERLDEAASASLFGQFRSNMADFLWLKVDKYLHSGVDMRGLTPLERQGVVPVDRAGNAGGKDAEGERQHTAETTVVPAVRLDWRGVFGALEREIKPYKDMTHHTHRDPKETLPLFRLMTWSNPHFIPGYTVGAAMIARDHAKFPEAIAFLREGERNNPQSIEIATELGQMYTIRTRYGAIAATAGASIASVDATGGKSSLAAGIPFLRKAIELGRGRDKTTLTEDENEALEDAYRWAVLNRRELKDPKAAQAYAMAGLKLFPNDVVCKHYLESHGALPEPEMHVIE